MCVCNRGQSLDFLSSSSWGPSGEDLEDGGDAKSNRKLNVTTTTTRANSVQEESINVINSCYKFRVKVPWLLVATVVLCLFLSNVRVVLSNEERGSKAIRTFEWRRNGEGVTSSALALRRDASDFAGECFFSR